MHQPNPGNAPSSDDSPISLFDLLTPLQLVLLGIALVSLQQILLATLAEAVANFFVAIAVAVLAVFVAIPLGLIRRTEVGVKDTLGFTPLTATQFGWTTLAAIALVLPVNALSEWNVQWIAPPAEFESLLEDLRPVGAAQWGLALLVIGGVVPVGEEIVFRGILQQAVRHSLPPAMNAVLVGVLFGVLHWEPWYLLGLAAMGIAMGLAMEFTGSLAAAILVHVVYNLAALSTFALPTDYNPAWLDFTRWGAPVALGSGALAGLALYRLYHAPARA